MKIEVLKRRDAEVIEKLTEVWRRSVVTTHHFLSAQDIEDIAGYVPRALAQVAELVVAVDEQSQYLAFMGIEKRRIEMLFIAPTGQGKGLGRKLAEYAFAHYGVDEVTVNEQNQQAVGFYQHLGFEVYKCTPLDEQGQPFPLLYMKRVAQS